MYRRMRATGLVVAMMGLLLCSCSEKAGEEKPVARAFDNYLYQSDLENLVPEGVGGEDSITIVNNYINQWMQQMVVLEKAKSNVSSDFERELNNYKNSLLTYEYERMVIAQLLDTVVSNGEIETYYNEHKDNFTLRMNIVRAVYVKVAKDAPVVNRLKKLISGKWSDDTMLELQRIASMYGKDYSFEEDQWMPFQKLQMVVPIETYNESLFLRNNSSVLIKDDAYVYAVRILDFKITDEVSPLEYERERICTIILNARKIDIIKNMQRDLLKKAEVSCDIERYKS